MGLIYRSKTHSGTPKVLFMIIKNGGGMYSVALVNMYQSVKNTSIKWFKSQLHYSRCINTKIFVKCNLLAKTFSLTCICYGSLEKWNKQKVWVS